MAAAVRKIPTQLISNSTTSFPARPTRNLSWGFSPLYNLNKIYNLHFAKSSIWSSEVGYKLLIWADFMQHNFISHQTIFCLYFIGLVIGFYWIGWFFRKVSLVLHIHPKRKSQLLNRRCSTVRILFNLWLYRPRGSWTVTSALAEL